VIKLARIAQARPLLLAVLFAASSNFHVRAEEEGGPAMPEALAELHAANADCEAPEDLPTLDRTRIELDADKELWLIPCYAGAYNFAYAAYRNVGKFYERVLFSQYSDVASWTGTGILINPEWNEANATLTTYDMGRGIGDCGSRGEWRNREGFLRLERFFYKPDCDGKGEPGVFPLVYEAKPL